jgi:hypothetical protein
MSGLVWAPKDPSEVDDRGLDFAALLESGETLMGTPTVTVSVLSGTDATPANIKSGAASISGSIVWQRLTGGVAGVVYKIRIQVATSTSRTLVGCAHLRVATC